MPTAPIGRRAREAGAALVVVLWVSALLAVLALGFSTGMRRESRAAANMVESLRAEALADAAVQRGINDLLRGREAGTLPHDGTPHPFAFGGGALTVSIEDEHGKVDLNRASSALLTKLLQSVGVANDRSRALSDAIADWRDPDRARRFKGAEEADYREAGLKFLPTNGPFRTVAELRQVYGMDRATADRLMPFVTVHSLSPRVNPMFAAREVLAAIPGVNPDQVDAIIAARKESLYASSNAALPLLSGVAGWISQSQGPVYTVRGSAKLPSGARFVREVVVWIPPAGAKGYWILDARVGIVTETATKDAKP